jgi:glutamate synthase domain-containing protein 3
MKSINADHLEFRALNELIDKTAKTEKEIVLKDVCGQRYIGRALGNVKLKIYGTPGNDMAAFADGAEIEVFGSAQDAAGNTMNAGRIIVHGNSGDTVGYAMRGGEIYIEGNVGYRAGIHMKEYGSFKPVVVVGGVAGDFLGEYMAGGALILLGLGRKKGESITGRFCATGMHGGAIYLHGGTDKFNLGVEACEVALTDEDKAFLKKHLTAYSKYFKKDLSSVKVEKFVKYVALNKNPYKNMYCSN